MKHLNKFIFIARHTERADLLPNANLDLLNCGRYDTELTDLGKTQAFIAGQKIKNFLIKHKHEQLFQHDYNKNIKDSLDQHSTHFDKISIVSSPFARTIFTATEIVKALNINIPIRIEKGLSEHLSDKWYPHHPQNDLISQHLHNKKFSTKGKDFFLSQIQNHELIQDRLTCMPEYPESHEQCHIRLKHVYDKLIQHHMEHINNIALILVTHHFPVEIFHRFYHDENESLPSEYGITMAFKYDIKFKRPVFVEKLFPR